MSQKNMLRGGINIVKTLHYANVLWLLSDSAAKLDDALW